MRCRKELTEEQWTKVAPLLPPQKPERGRPAKDHRTVLNAIFLWVLRTGAPWRDLPERYGPWQRRPYSRFYRWQKQGIWQEVLEELQKEKDSLGEVGWEIHFVDSTTG
jgi:transposase